MTESDFTQFGIHEPWIQRLADLPHAPLLRDWLLNTGSLTERLQANCRNFEVSLLGQQVAEISDDEKTFLYGQFGKSVEDTQVREVFLKGNGALWVFARSLLPISFLANEMDELTRLGTQPLGKIIFNDARFVRQSFQLVECHGQGETLTQLGIRSHHPCWGRRSLFQFKSFHIMVAEVFLPDSPAYANYDPSYANSRSAYSERTILND